MPSFLPGQDIFSGRHTFVAGATQQGKTHFTMARLKSVKVPVLFFNPQEEPCPWMTKATPANDVQQIIAVLKKGGKVNFIPALDDDRAAVQLQILTDALFTAGFSKSHNMIFGIDECHLLSDYRQGVKAINKVATRGLKWGIHAVFLTQRPANASKNAFTQSDRQILFQTGMEKEYFTRKGIDHAAYAAKIQQGGKYSYCVLEGVNLTGPYKEG